MTPQFQETNTSFFFQKAEETSSPCIGPASPILIGTPLWFQFVDDQSCDTSKATSISATNLGNILDSGCQPLDASANENFAR